MNNFYIAFAVYLNLIFIAAKIWDQIDWSWFWIMTPVIILTLVGMIATMGQKAKRKKSGSDILNNIISIRNLIESSKAERAERQGMAIGTLVHSEIWNNLEKFDFQGQIKMRAFRTIVATDEIFRDFAIKAQDKRNKRGNKPDGLDNIRNQMESLESPKQG